MVWDSTNDIRVGRKIPGREIPGGKYRLAKFDENGKYWEILQKFISLNLNSEIML